MSKKRPRQIRHRKTVPEIAVLTLIVLSVGGVLAYGGYQLYDLASRRLAPMPVVASLETAEQSEEKAEPAEQPSEQDNDDSLDEAPRARLAPLIRSKDPAGIMPDWQELASSVREQVDARNSGSLSPNCCCAARNIQNGRCQQQFGGEGTWDA